MKKLFRMKMMKKKPKRKKSLSKRQLLMLVNLKKKRNAGHVNKMKFLSLTMSSTKKFQVKQCDLKLLQD